MTKVVVARIYLTEAEKRLNPIMRYLHDEAKVSGVTVFRGITGFGASGKMHEAKFVDLSLDMPLVIEFFDLPERVRAIVKHLSSLVDQDHIITWEATRIHGAL